MFWYISLYTSALKAPTLALNKSELPLVLLQAVSFLMSSFLKFPPVDFYHYLVAIRKDGCTHFSNTIRWR